MRRAVVLVGVGRREVDAVLDVACGGLGCVGDGGGGRGEVAGGRRRGVLVARGNVLAKASDTSRDNGMTGITTYGSQQELRVDGSGALAVRVAPRKAVDVE